LGKELLDTIAKALAEKASVERPPAMEGNSMSLILFPHPTKQPKKEKENEKEKETAGETVDA
jgi:hypothetical protein